MSQPFAPSKNIPKKLISYVTIGSVIAMLIYGVAQHEEIHKSLKPTFNVNTPWGAAVIMTPWGKEPEKATSPVQFHRRPEDEQAIMQEERTKILEQEKQKNKIIKCTINGETLYTNIPCDKQ